jgi:hypothetical protein
LLPAAERKRQNGMQYLRHYALTLDTGEVYVNGNNIISSTNQYICCDAAVVGA